LRCGIGLVILPVCASIKPVNVAATEIAKKLRSSKPPRLLDVRQPEEHELVALPRSVLIPLGQLFHRMAELDSWKDDEIVVYCHHGIRSQQAISMLRTGLAQGLAFDQAFINMVPDFRGLEKYPDYRQLFRPKG